MCVGARVGEEEVVCIREERVAGMGVVEIKEEIVDAIVVKVADEVVFVCAVIGRAMYVSSDINSLGEEWRSAMVGELYVSLEIYLRD